MHDRSLICIDNTLPASKTPSEAGIQSPDEANVHLIGSEGGVSGFDRTHMTCSATHQGISPLLIPCDGPFLRTAGTTGH